MDTGARKGLRSKATTYRVVRARLTSKGQITIPVEIRRTYDLEAGDELAFRMAEGELTVTPVKRRAASSFQGALPGTRPYPGTAAIRKEVDAARLRDYAAKRRATARPR